jgi:hypothetical protein
MVDISQPHMHNVLKGTRSLSPELSDRVLRHLRLSVLDLIEKEKFADRVNGSWPGARTGDENVRNSVILPTARAKQRPELVWAIYPSVNVARTPYADWCVAQRSVAFAAR